MKILVAVKEVASLDDDFEIRDDQLDVDEDFLLYDLNEWDDFSLEEAMNIKEASDSEVEVVVVSVGPDRVEESLRKCLAKGADRAIRVWSDEMEGSDSITVGRILAAVAEQEKPDMIFAGVQSSDDANASTGISLSSYLNWPHAAVVAGLDYTPGSNKAVVSRELEGGMAQEVEISCPAVLTIQLGINTPRYASLRGIKQAAAKPIEEISLSDLGLSAEDVGADASFARVRRMYIPEKGMATMIEGTPAEQAAKLAEIIKEYRGEL
ncbi:electron transfer flavoprotein, beta subunit [Methylophaga aminisulfidivorans MP]|uniref:Electron transfer flavoprotein subunit beta n=1 Tax=Methylophaga aminisulfidivorans MP TaxID=1026882 RepID=F5T355_9GAMM|nr:electron transfer flavoprotein subunit beta/FixA family protein [Methylophaga aminisulfidivorans]EGL53481.1 electron transfer flavoprotein, beta subunit [Methylophaga aminisulfidivorans MP]